MKPRIEIRRTRKTKGLEVVGMLVCSERGLRYMQRRRGEALGDLRTRALHCRRGVLAVREVLIDVR